MQIAKEALQNDDSNEEGLTEEDLKVQTVLKQSLSVRRLAGPSVRSSVRFSASVSLSNTSIDYLGRAKLCQIENCTKIVCLSVFHLSLCLCVSKVIDQLNMDCLGHNN
jgi:hypothetical protein